MKVFTERPGKRQTAVQSLCAAVADHLYGAELLSKFGYAQASARVRSVLPRGKQIRSGDLGEIIATEYIARRTEYRVPVKRLRYKDDREMSMRGDDVIGLASGRGPTRPAPSAAQSVVEPPTAAVGATGVGPGGPGPRSERTRVLKAEVKSYASLSSTVVGTACSQLDANEGRPKPSTLAFLAHKLRLAGQDDEAELIEYLQEHQVRVTDLEHLVFVVCGNNPLTALTAHAGSSGRGITRQLVGVRVDGHGLFIASVFETLARGPEAAEPPLDTSSAADAPR